MIWKLDSYLIIVFYCHGEQKYTKCIKCFSKIVVLNRKLISTIVADHPSCKVIKINLEITSMNSFARFRHGHFFVLIFINLYLEFSIIRQSDINVLYIAQNTINKNKSFSNKTKTTNIKYFNNSMKE